MHMTLLYSYSVLYLTMSLNGQSSNLLNVFSAAANHSLTYVMSAIMSDGDIGAHKGARVEGVGGISSSPLPGWEEGGGNGAGRSWSSTNG